MRIAPAMLAIFASVFIAVVATVAEPVQPVAAAAKQRCTQWNSTTQPPPDIAVYRVSEGKVERVDFKLYVARVTSREWNIKQDPLRIAGAHAVKQYAWFHVLHYRGGKFNGDCFDVRDTTADQLYSNKPRHQIPRTVWRAVNKTWSWRLMRDGKLPMTGYSQGPRAGCAENGGYRLYVRSAKQCAKLGWSAERILEKYYTANLIK